MTQLKSVLVIGGVLALGVLALGFSSTPNVGSGSWQVDTRHSDAQLITDGTTNFGKTKLNYTLGYGRVSGAVMLDDQDATKSSVELHIYPATAMSESIAEDGNFKAQWLSNLANHTLLCFHSKKVVRTADGKLQTTGELVLTRVDRNVQVDPNEAYSGPVYGPPMIHKTSREATFEIDLSPAGSGTVKELQASGSTQINREAFPHLVKSVVNTYWPPLVQDEKCKTPTNVSEDYRGSQCTGTFMEAAGLPQAPTTVGEDYPAQSNYSATVGSQVTILLHMQLSPRAPMAKAAGAQ
jgi:polyisoprenoid-binding protein YceI